MEKVSYYTEEGLQRLKGELTQLKTEGRAKVAEQLSEARDKGDLSENAEYDAAKEAQEILERRIAKLEELMINARVINKDNINTSAVSILSKVKIKNKKLGKVSTYTMVSEEEADLKEGKISIESPIGKGLLGKKVGEVAIVEAPAGKIEFEILDISF
ncbi:MAG: transcription elongation factor GreA [Candidatus Amoebophilus sp.]